MARACGSNRETRVGEQEKIGPHPKALEDPSGEGKTRTWPRESDFLPLLYKGI